MNTPKFEQPEAISALEEESLDQDLDQEEMEEELQELESALGLEEEDA